MENQILGALVQNFGFQHPKKGKLPTVDFVYPDYIADGLSEAFRFYESLRQELSERSPLVQKSFEDKEVIYTNNEAVLLEVAEVAPRLRLKEQIKGEVNSIYAYCPLLFVGADPTDSEYSIFVVNPIPGSWMAWFELTKEETQKIIELLRLKAKEKPCRNIWQRISEFFN